jgi:hypothetical protein
MFQCQPLTPSDIIEVIGIIASLVTSIVAIIISIKTLKQNSRMIEESTRPYVVVYSRTTNFQTPNYYLVVKNFGQSGAIVTSLKCDYDLSTCSYRKDHVPFAHFENTFIAPGQSFITNIDRLKFFENPSELHFFIKYTANGVTYSDQFTINPKVDVDLIQTRASTAGKELHNISYTLQDFVEKLL